VQHSAHVTLSTYMHVHLLSIASEAVQNRCDNHQLVFRAEVAHAALELGGVAGGHGVQVEFEGGGKRQEK
jgi:hypothetical protein